MFIEERLLDCVSYGTVYGERFSTDVQTMRNKQESRNANWSQSQFSAQIIFAALEEKDRAKVMKVFRTCRGRAIGFRLKNWVDYKIADEPIGIGTGASQDLQLKITYKIGTYKTEKNIHKPIYSKLEILADGLPVAFVLSSSGVVTFTADAGAVITWSGEYDIPVRFDVDDIMWSVDNKSAGGFVMGTDIPIVEIAV